jgi:hypothetical protein
MTILPVADFDTAQNFFGGVRTKPLANARWIRWSIAKVNRSRFCTDKLCFVDGCHVQVYGAEKSFQRHTHLKELDYSRIVKFLDTNRSVELKLKLTTYEQIHIVSTRCHRCVGVHRFLPAAGNDRNYDGTGSVTHSAKTKASQDLRWVGTQACARTVSCRVACADAVKNERDA